MADTDCLKCHAPEGPEGRRTAGRCSSTPPSSPPRATRRSAAPSATPRSWPPSLERPCDDDHGEGELRLLPRGGRPAVREEHPRQARPPGRPERPDLRGVPRDARRRSGKSDAASPTFARNVPKLCAQVPPRGGEGRAALRRASSTRSSRTSPSRSTARGSSRAASSSRATCTSLPHGAQRPAGEGPRVDREPGQPARHLRPVPPRRRGEVPEEHPLRGSSRSRRSKLPVCEDCHSAHTIRRTDQVGFKLDVMSSCGKCHKDVTETYFDTFHGKVSQLGYAKTAKCNDCHGAHDILPAVGPGLAPLPRERRRDLPAVPPGGERAASRATSPTRRTTTRTSTRSSSSRSGG